MSEYLLTAFFVSLSVPWRAETTVTTILKAITFILQLLEVLAMDLLIYGMADYN